MLIEKNLAEQFLFEYQLALTYINHGKLPDGLQDLVALRAEMYECVDEVKANMSHALSVGLLKGLERAVYGRFIFLKKYKDGYVFLHPDSSQYFQVKGLTSAIEEICPEYSPVETAILPFSDELVCDGLLVPLSATFGATVRKEFRDGYWAAKKSGTLIKIA
ncbi:hypothetical protein [Vibrio sp. CUB2]|uniref:hypothetical protein n=1 Tax=Vibrio sp. CUB2 TaxID=2315233 RepID=UPI00076A1953|nr:hypothetical protein [Vibrio sp. CUB2]